MFLSPFPWQTLTSHSRRVGDHKSGPTARKRKRRANKNSSDEDDDADDDLNDDDDDDATIFAPLSSDYEDAALTSGAGTDRSNQHALARRSWSQSYNFAAELSAADTVQYKLAGLEAHERPPKVEGFPHVGIPRESKDEAKANGQSRFFPWDLKDILQTQHGLAPWGVHEHADVRLSKTSAADNKRKHAGVLLRMLHRCLQTGDLARASRAFKLLLHTELQSCAPDMRFNDTWTLGLEILLRQSQPALPSSAFFSAAKEYCDRLTLFHGQSRVVHTVLQYDSTVDFQLGLLGLWIAKVEQQRDEHRVVHEEGGQGSWPDDILIEIIKEAYKISDSIKELVERQPFSEVLEFWQLHKSVLCWVVNMLDDCTDQDDALSALETTIEDLVNEEERATERLQRLKERPVGANIDED